MTTGTLEDFSGDMVMLVCERCDKRNRYLKKKMIQRYGLNLPLEKILARSAECSLNPAYGKACEARFEGQ
ncbi:MAG: hypothetical protein QF384_04415 [Alphaproteobacteria bacterium]|jgi:hypothetical protein|nr:hypothetical protein [Alphaproteobacteria bacterium]MDP6830435.1 hypothetical protein [Alphaproteobacteria bacterium]MDP6872075.1 hypothetical protein [Alphaproteobacteria bacterium]